MPERQAHREICSRCHEVSRVGFAVPNDVWERATHHSERNAIICLACFTKLADERGVEWDRDIKLFPVSWIALMRTTRTFMGNSHQGDKTPESMTRESRRAKQLLGEALRAAWVSYVKLLGEPPHGTPTQLLALAELVDLNPLLAAQQEKVAAYVARKARSDANALNGISPALFINLADEIRSLK